MIRPQHAHPPVEQLCAFARGQISLVELTAIESHLQSCAACCDALESLPDDDLVSLIRAVGRSPRPSSPSEDGGKSLPHSVPPAEKPHVDGYEVGEELGRGGMGIVYKARHLALGRVVALKVLAAGVHSDVARRARFRTEAEAIARLRHPNVVQVYDTGIAQGLPYFALEYVEDGTLAALIQATPQPPAASAAFVATAARGVAAAHAEGIVHRDLKPANILLARKPGAGAGPGAGLDRFMPRISDFGLAKWAEHAVGLTQTDILLGTPAYMAPEQAGGRHQAVGPPADVYTLGAVLYELLTGRPPFRGSSLMDTLDQIRHAEPVPPGRLVPRLPRDLETICLKCLEKDPSRRYPDADALAKDLDRFGRGEPITARPVGPAGRVWKWVRRHPLSAALVAVTVAALLVGTAVSTFFAIEAGRRAREADAAKKQALDLAGERQQALDVASRARHEEARRTAELTFREGLNQCEAGAVAKGLFTLLDAWTLAPADVDDFRRVIRTNLAAWRWQLPILRGVVTHGDGGRVELSVLEPDGKTFLTRDREYVQLWDTERVVPIGPPSPARDGEHIKAVGSDGMLLSGLPDGRHFFRQVHGQPADDLLLPDWVRELKGIRLLRKGPGRAGLLVSGPLPEARDLGFWHLENPERDPVRVPYTSDVYFHVARDRDGREILALFRQDRGEGVGAAHQAEFWDLESGQRLSGFTPRRGGTDPYVTWDGRTLLSVNSYLGFPYAVPAAYDGSVRWWDPATGRQLGAAWQPRRQSRYSELSQDGSILAAWGRDGRFRLFELATGMQLGGDVALGPAAYDPDEPVVRLTPDGGTVIAVGRSGMIGVWETRHLRAQETLAASSRLPLRGVIEPSDAPRAAFSPDGRTVLVCAPPESHLAWLSEVRRSLPRGKPLSHPHPFNPAFSPDGKLVVTISQNHIYGGEPLARVWDAATGEPRTPVLQNPKYLHTAAFSPDGRTLALGGPGGAWLWDLPTARMRHQLPEQTATSRLAFSPDGRSLATGCRRGWPGVGPGTRLWDAQTGQPIGDFIPTKGDVKWLRFTEGGQTLLAFSREGELYRLETETGRPRSKPLQLPPPRIATFSPDGSRLATVNSDGVVRQWDTATGQAVGRAMVPANRVVVLVYGPDATPLATLTDDQGVRLWDGRSGLPLGPPLLHRASVLAVAFSPDGRSVLTVTDDGRTYTWPIPAPVSDDQERIRLWLQATTGVLPVDGEVRSLEVETWRQRREMLTRRWPERDPALALLSDPAERHDRLAADAEEDGNTTASLQHLDALIMLRPDDWSPHARKGRAYAQIEAFELAAEAYAQAEARDREKVADWYRHQIAILRDHRQHQAAWEWYKDRLQKLEVGGE